MKKIFAANWKLQKTPQQTKVFCEQLLKQWQPEAAKEVFIFPQNFSLMTALEHLSAHSVFVGPQNIHSEKSGAFTGENSADFAKSMGAKTILLGHSERRQYFHEDSKSLNKKIKICQELDLLPMYCIGETLADRESGNTEKICFEQLTSVLSDVDTSKRIIIAYEPVWAIGTGKVASPDQIQNIHAQIYKKLQDLKFQDFQILYGGSVKSDNAKELIKLPHVDGFLIGGASLEVESFLKIINCLN